MTQYLIELGLIHLILMAGYWILLRKERQHGKIRFYLIASTLLAIVIPMLKLPDPFYTPQEYYYTPASGSSMDVLVSQPDIQPSGWDIHPLLAMYAAVSLFLLFKLTSSVMHIVHLNRQSSREKFNDLPVRKVKGIDGSFTFFNWIFLNDELGINNDDYQIILKHEQSHVALGHSYDLLFLEICKVCFWWLPTLWYAISETKKIHEYQADAYALKECGVDRYSSILISSALKKNGLSLASSFHDGLILKRLNEMKEQKTNVSLWKLGALSFLSAFLFVVFACSEAPDAAGVEGASQNGAVEDPQRNIFTVVEETPQYPGGLGALYSYMANEITYPKQAIRSGVEGKVWVQFVIEKDGTISDVQVVKGIHPDIDRETQRALKNAASFKPASQRGRPVRVRRVMPVVFKLDPEKKNPDNTSQGVVLVEEIQNLDQKFKIEANYSREEWSGTVYDEETGEALPGANIVVMGTTHGTVSDIDGSFKLKAEPSNVLMISFVGYEHVRLEGKQ